MFRGGGGGRKGQQMGLRRGTQGRKKKQGWVASWKSGEDGPSCRRLTSCATRS